MYTLTVKVAGAGAPLSNGKTSTAGHMWYSLSNGSDSAPLSFGFASTNGLPLDKGALVDDDDGNYLSTIYTGQVAITKEQYDALKDFGKNPDNYNFNKNIYNAGANSCIDFTWTALKAAGINPSSFEGNLFPSDNVASVDQRLHKQLFGNTTDIYHLDQWNSSPKHNAPSQHANGLNVAYGSKDGGEIKANNNVDIVYGGAGKDKIYGNDKDNILDGGKGADYLEGGAGRDTYIVNNGDTIKDDKDGKGAVKLYGLTLSGGTHREGDPKNIYRGFFGEKYTYNQSTKELTASIFNQTITIKDFDIDKKGGYLGIKLTENINSEHENSRLSKPVDVSKAIER
jgi:Ca2+-binding RTX toxin-like protein